MWNRVFCEIDDRTCYDVMYGYMGSSGRRGIGFIVRLVILLVIHAVCLYRVSREIWNRACW